MHVTQVFARLHSSLQPGFNLAVFLFTNVLNALYITLYHTDFALFPQIQQYDGATTDDTGANAIYIYCKSAISLEVTGNISSATMSFGDLEDTKFCAENYWIVDYTVCNGIK